MRIAVFSDIHWQYQNFCSSDFPEAEACICAGDWSGSGQLEESADFAAWYRKLPYGRKIAVPGNHDRAFVWFPEEAGKIFSDAGIELLLDSGTEIGGLKVWGSPWCPSFGDGRWAFLASEHALESKFRKIPEDTGLLVTHCPPLCILDYAGDNFGSRALLDAVSSRKGLKAHVFGHIHGSHGYERKGEKDFYNVSLLDDDYKIAFPVTVIDI
jgi:Icc-related predicted phosphoesterase